MKNLLLIIGLLTAHFSSAQHTHKHSRVVKFPDVPGYKSITTDFHIHTVFSDGSVWPDIRIQEALKDSVDAISLTEHIEYQPHEADMPHKDRNRAYELATKYARPHRVIVINGSEITRDMPPGHNNAIFIKDANKLQIADSIDVFKEANRQGAFAFWLHPNWIPQRNDGVARLTDMHKFLIKEKLLHGIEVVNDYTYSDEALQIALDNNLTIMGTSDIHGLVDWQYHIEDGGHRPTTIVLGKEKTKEGIKEGLFAGRTIVYFNDMLIGKAENVIPLIKACLNIEKAEYMGKADVARVKIYNNSAVPFILANLGNYTFHNTSDIITLKPYQTTIIEVKTLQQLANFELPFKVMNAVIAPKSHPNISLKVEVE